MTAGEDRPTRAEGAPQSHLRHQRLVAFSMNVYVECAGISVTNMLIPDTQKGIRGAVCTPRRPLLYSCHTVYICIQPPRRAQPSESVTQSASRSFKFQNNLSRALILTSSPRSHRNAATPPINMIQERIKGGKFVFDTFPRGYVANLTVDSEDNFLLTTKKEKGAEFTRHGQRALFDIHTRLNFVVHFTPKPVQSLCPTQQRTV